MEAWVEPRSQPSISPNSPPCICYLCNQWLAGTGRQQCHYSHERRELATVRQCWLFSVLTTHLSQVPRPPTAAACSDLPSPPPNDFPAHGLSTPKSILHTGYQGPFIKHESDLITILCRSRKTHSKTWQRLGGFITWLESAWVTSGSKEALMNVNEWTAHSKLWWAHTL